MCDEECALVFIVVLLAVLSTYVLVAAVTPCLEVRRANATQATAGVESPALAAAHYVVVTDPKGGVLLGKTTLGKGKALGMTTAMVQLKPPRVAPLPRVAGV